MCDCLNCSDITVPIGPQGNTGPTGPSGIDGTNGTDGASVLHNDITNSTTTGTSLQVLKTYTLTANTLSTDGSFIEVKSRFSTSTSSDYTKTKKVSLWFNGTKLGESIFNINNVDVFEFTLQVHRFSNTSAKSKLNEEVVYAILPFVAGAIRPGFVITGGLNFTTTGYNIEAKGDSDVTGDVTCESLTIVKYKK